MADHQIEADETSYGVAAYLIVQQLVRQLADLDKRFRELAAGVLEDAATTAEISATSGGGEAAALIRRILEVAPFVGTET